MTILADNDEIYRTKDVNINNECIACALPVPIHCILLRPKIVTYAYKVCKATGNMCNLISAYLS